ncbi:MAG: non-heme iron oxygenase ferredoxin subunit [Deltaproteobacteria bacterium]|nr:non-heme iron oxygenase ferredoxin subunit [Deltaproteobacteria bacterium]
MAEFVKAAKTDEIAPGQSKMLEVNGKKIAIFNVAGSFHAIDDICSHRGGSLSQGMIEGEKVTCPWHGAVFDIRSGEVLGPPAPKGVARYNVRTDGVQIEVEI